MFSNTSQLLPDELGRWASQAVITTLLLFVLYQTGYAIYNLYFHPLSKFPGPRLWAISRIPYVLAIRKGRFVFRVKEFHDRYNSHVIRVAPDELTFTDGSVWKDAYQFHQGQKDFPKHSVWLRPMVNGAWSILHADDVTHARIKRLLGHAFSTKALRGQEEFVHQYTNLLVQKLKESITTGQNIVDIMKWYNFTVFDIIGDLTYGEPFGCLKDGKNHPFVSKLFQQFKGATTLGTTRYFPGFEKLMYWMLPKSVVAMRWELFRRTQEKIQRRIDMQTDRLDLMHYVQRHNDEKGMSRDEIDATLTTLTIAGGETTNTFLSGTTYFLIQNPKVWKKLSTEIRGAFKSEDEINDLELEKLPYFGAVIKEGLRLIPPLASGHPRIVPPGGRTVAGHWLPEGTVLHVVAWAASRSPLNFANPDKFDPERWLHHNGYDDVSAFQPFSVGSRGCIARNLAMLSLRLIMAWMIWNFDISVPGGGTEVPWEWSSQNVFLVWEKRPLFVELKVVKH